ncbi:TetR family transcriptional regulator [Paenibacillus sp. MMS20-IR301]|uniref:TetR family transcriptional regulator n=1 Tax=Paenibacillus sp. MMS20-IR301 TaxID=2895946 RepID=UPI0028E852ED|nr:TetR family transcriptional regulator [Paenibacillus sp. MMS20-IR301]WNS44100.1 TetR family transcriptional regulator [Paenibacillus sp. MMS20-IR301]
MANKVMNVRVTQTKQSLVNAFLGLVPVKDFAKITIADITDKAKVNRATFYAHFNDKYELLDYMMGDSASAAIGQRIAEIEQLDCTAIRQLVLAVCDYYSQPEVQCRSSYIALVVPQLKVKMLAELKNYLLECLGRPGPGSKEEEELKLQVAFAAHAIHEGAVQWVSGELQMDKEQAADKVALLVAGGLRAAGREI